MKRIIYFAILYICVFIVPALSVKDNHNTLSLLFQSSRRRRKVDYGTFIRFWHQSKNKQKSFSRRNSKRRPDYQNSPWAKLLRESDAIRDPETVEGGLFRRRFRVPYPIFEVIVQIVRREMWFREESRRNGKKYFLFLFQCLTLKI